MEQTEQLTPLENYCAALDRAAQHAATLSATLKVFELHRHARPVTSHRIKETIRFEKCAPFHHI